MPKLVSFLALPVLLAAIGYQFFTGPGTFVHDSLGIGRPVVGVNNHSCQKIPELPACEDMWLHQETGLLYLACSDVVGRLNWLPATDNLNADKAPETDYIAILDTRASGPITSRLTHVKTSGFNKPLYLHGLDVWQVASSDEDSKPTLRVFVNSHNPARDPQTGKLLDAHKLGANSTIEVFETTLGASTMRHIRTHAHPEIRTPNRPAATGPDSFLFTNDHRDKVGHARVLDIFLPRSNIGFCDTKGCHSAYQGLSFPNGIVRVSFHIRHSPTHLLTTLITYFLERRQPQALLRTLLERRPHPFIRAAGRQHAVAAGRDQGRLPDGQPVCRQQEQHLRRSLPPIL